MPEPEDTTASWTGPGPRRPDVDIGALYARLQQEVALTRVGGADSMAQLRELAERYWAVTAERALERRPGLKGALIHRAKKLLRPLLRWYVEPLAFDQRMFNDAVLQLIGDLEARLREAERRASMPPDRSAS